DLLARLETFDFNRPGSENTGEVPRIVGKRAEELDIEMVLVASTRDTAVVLTLVNPQNFLDLRVKEILYKPRF
ncbi:MAG: hypothetical protein QGI57_05395, partial [Dehalococcoidales bacterium]|nr:hypothetical protein [Dehalococcoidales bacterium]